MPFTYREPISDDLLALESDARDMADPLTEEEQIEAEEWARKQIESDYPPLPPNQREGHSDA